jgi:type II secretory pathway pseudopilin PulG
MSERGFTLVELLVSMAIAMVVTVAVLALVDVSMSNSARVTARVDANQRARPVLQRLVDELHSTCLGPDNTPVLAGSGPDSISFQHQTGSAVSPVPVKRQVTLSGSTLTESVYPVTGGAAPDWVYASTPSSTRQLLTDVGLASTGAPLFQYFADESGRISTTPLETPLSDEDAALTVQVTVSFSVAPRSTPVTDAGAAVSVSDSAVFRFSPFSEDPTKVNGPCT